jgi:hypothetical protein
MTATVHMHSRSSVLVVHSAVCIAFSFRILYFSLFFLKKFFEHTPPPVNQLSFSKVLEFSSYFTFYSICVFLIEAALSSVFNFIL